MDEYWIWMSMLKFVGPVSQKVLLEKFNSPKGVYEANKLDLLEIGINKRAVESITANKSLKEAEIIVQDIQKKNINLLRFHDPQYPIYAKSCSESPILLYYKGSPIKLMNETVAVVGSRRCTAYGKRISQEIGKELALNNISLISGFAKGIDSYAQAACIHNGGYTIGFLANGVDICYPREQRNLFDEILQAGGAFISQHPPGTKPKPDYFPQRNALIAAWAREVIIVEAEKKSGALWTAQFAKKYGKELFAVPNQLGVREGVGTNGLVASGWAKLYLGPASLTALRGKKNTDLTIAEQHPILTCLDDSPKSIKEIAEYLGKPEETLLEDLLTLEFQGKVTIRGSMVFKN